MTVSSRTPSRLSYLLSVSSHTSSRFSYVDVWCDVPRPSVGVLLHSVSTFLPSVGVLLHSVLIFLPRVGVLSHSVLTFLPYVGVLSHSVSTFLILGPETSTGRPELEAVTSPLKTIGIRDLISKIDKDRAVVTAFHLGLDVCSCNPSCKKSKEIRTCVHPIPSRPKPANDIDHTTTRTSSIYQPVTDVPPAVGSPKAFLTMEALSKSPGNKLRHLTVVLDGGTSVEISNHHHLPAIFYQCIDAIFQNFMIVLLEYLTFSSTRFEDGYIHGLTPVEVIHLHSGSDPVLTGLEDPSAGLVFRIEGIKVGISCEHASRNRPEVKRGTHG
ncbi:hypothetical protein BYT27DRAFT_7217341 [Phlegmacium glaucopus]|nr:hypothetical protein BYT27DRAFT_7217341 [Phlegmacium glaucopus]